MKPSTWDKILYHLNPRRAAERLMDKMDFEMMSKGAYGGSYKGVIDSRFRTWQAQARSTVGTEDHAVGARNRKMLRLECRDKWRNSEIGRAIVDRYAEYSIWKGIVPQAKTSDEKWNQEAEAWWNQIYSKTCDYRQLPGVDMVKLQEQVVTNQFLDGDCGFILLANGQILPIEAERIATPDKWKQDKNVTEGIVTTPGGIYRGVFVCDRKDKGAIDNTKAKFVPRENFIFVYDPSRFDQLRGIPRLAPALAKLTDYDETDESVMNKVKLDAMQQFKRFIKVLDWWI